MKEIEKITLFYEISNVLNEHLDLERSLYNVLNILAESMGMERGTVSILSPLSNEISIEVAHGLSESAMAKGKYKLGEGITGKVIQTGKAVTIPKISEEPQFLDRTATRKTENDDELSFKCKRAGFIKSRPFWIIDYAYRQLGIEYFLCTFIVNIGNMRNARFPGCFPVA